MCILKHYLITFIGVIFVFTTIFAESSSHDIKRNKHIQIRKKFLNNKHDKKRLRKKSIFIKDGLLHYNLGKERFANLMTSIKGKQNFYNEAEVTKEFKAIYKLFLRAARKNHQDAQYKVGIMLLNGNGVDRNKTDAMLWIKKAAKNEHPSARKILQDLKRDKCSATF